MARLENTRARSESTKVKLESRRVKLGNRMERLDCKMARLENIWENWGTSGFGHKMVRLDSDGHHMECFGLP